MIKRTPDEFASVLNAFSPAIKSVDIRTAAIKLYPSQKTWINLMTSILLSEKTISEVKKEHSLLPKIKNDQFAIFLEATSQGHFIDNLVQGIITFHGKEPTTVISREFNPLNLKFVSSRKRINGKLKWVFTTSDSTKISEERIALLSVLAAQNSEAKRANYESSFDLVEKILHLDNFSSGETKDFEIALSIGVTLNRTVFGEASFEVDIQTLGVKGLQLNLALSRENGYSADNIIWRQTFPVEEKNQIADEKSSFLKMVIPVPDILPFDYMTAELIHRDSALTIDIANDTAPLNNSVEPFLKTLTAFCSFEGFEKMLFEPEKYGKQPNKIFENAVTWLLSLAGFSTIHLGAEIKTSKGKKSFDSLKASESGYEIGSADIIAYQNNERILLIDCDIGQFDEKKIGMLEETCKHLETSNKLKKNFFVPVFCSPRDCKSAYQTCAERSVTLADKNVIKNILEDVVKGDYQKARRKI